LSEVIKKKFINLLDKWNGIGYIIDIRRTDQSNPKPQEQIARGSAENERH